jgi:hypothetical protein
MSAKQQLDTTEEWRFLRDPLDNSWKTMRSGVFYEVRAELLWSEQVPLET